MRLHYTIIPPYSPCFRRRSCEQRVSAVETLPRNTAAALFLRAAMR